MTNQQMVVTLARNGHQRRGIIRVRFTGHAASDKHTVYVADASDDGHEVKLWDYSSLAAAESAVASGFVGSYSLAVDTDHAAAIADEYAAAKARAAR